MWCGVMWCGCGVVVVVVAVWWCGGGCVVMVVFWLLSKLHCTHTACSFYSASYVVFVNSRRKLSSLLSGSGV